MIEDNSELEDAILDISNYIAKLNDENRLDKSQMDKFFSYVNALDEIWEEDY